MRPCYLLFAFICSLIIRCEQQRTLLVDIDGAIGFVSPSVNSFCNKSPRTYFIASLIASACNDTKLSDEDLQGIITQAATKSGLSIHEAVSCLGSYLLDTQTILFDTYPAGEVIRCAINAMIEHHCVVHYLDSQIVSSDHSINKLTSTTLKDIMLYLHAQGILDTPLLDPHSPYHITEIGDFYITDQTFLVSYQTKADQTGLIIREMNRGIEQVARLYCGQQTNALAPALYPYALEQSVSLLFPVCYFSLKINTKERIYAIIPQAPGRQLSEYMKLYKEHPNKELLNRSRNAYYQAGRALRIIHQSFATTDQNGSYRSLIHGDFHHFHVFYDESTNRVSFIDNEYMAYFFVHKQQPTQDITNFFDETLGPNLTPAWFYDGFNTHEWVESTLESFLSGYLSYASPQERLPLMLSIWNAFKEKNDRWRQYEKYQEIFDRVVTHLIHKQGVSA